MTATTTTTNAELVQLRKFARRLADIAQKNFRASFRPSTTGRIDLPEIQRSIKENLRIIFTCNGRIDFLPSPDENRTIAFRAPASDRSLKKANQDNCEIELKFFVCADPEESSLDFNYRGKKSSLNDAICFFAKAAEELRPDGEFVRSLDFARAKAQRNDNIISFSAYFFISGKRSESHKIFEIPEWKMPFMKKWIEIINPQTNRNTNGYRYCLPGVRPVYFHRIIRRNEMLRVLDETRNALRKPDSPERAYALSRRAGGLLIENFKHLLFFPDECREFDRLLKASLLDDEDEMRVFFTADESREKLGAIFKFEDEPYFIHEDSSMSSHEKASIIIHRKKLNSAACDLFNRALVQMDEDHRRALLTTEKVQSATIFLDARKETIKNIEFNHDFFMPPQEMDAKFRSKSHFQFFFHEGGEKSSMLSDSFESKILHQTSIDLNTAVAENAATRCAMNYPTIDDVDMKILFFRRLTERRQPDEILALERLELPEHDS